MVVEEFSGRSERNAVNHQDHKDLNNNPIREPSRSILRNNLIQPLFPLYTNVRDKYYISPVFKF